MKIKKALVKAKMQEQGLTQEDAAKKCCIPLQKFKVIMAYGNSDGKNIGKLAKGLGVAVWELVA